MSVDADISDSVDLLGKSASDLQEGIVVGKNGVSGTLKYISDYSSAYGPGMDSGNYIVLHYSTAEEGSTITCELVGGTTDPVTLDPDGLNITRVTNKNTQTIKVVASKTGYTDTVKYISLKGLTLTPAP